MSTRHVCKDCRAEGRNETASVLDAPFPGPRCYAHNRAFRRAQRARNHDVYVQRTYGLAPGEYEEIKASQDGKCLICQVATGKTKRLATDHCHACNAVRGILCGPDNQLIGRLGPAALRRAADYLEAHQCLTNDDPMGV